MKVHVIYVPFNDIYIVKFFGRLLPVPTLEIFLFYIGLIRTVGTLNNTNLNCISSKL